VALPAQSVDDPKAEGAAPRSPQFAFVAAASLGVASAWNSVNLGPIADELATAYDVTLAEVGTLMAITVLVHSFVQLPAGSALDRYGVRRSGIVGLALMLACNGVAMFQPSYPLALSLRAVMGLGTALTFLAGTEAVRSGSGSTFAQGLWGGITLGGSGLALAVVPRLATWLGWRAPFASAIATCMLALGIVLVARTGARVTAWRRRPKGGRFSLLSADFIQLAAVNGASVGLAAVVANWIVPLLTRNGLPAPTAGLIGSLGMVGALSGRSLGGWLVGRLSNVMRLLVPGSLALSSISVVALATQREALVLVLAALLLGVSSGAPFGAVFSAAAKLVPSSPGVGVAAVNMCANLTVVAGTPLLGFAFAAQRPRLGLLAIAALSAAVAAFVVRGQWRHMTPADSAGQRAMNRQGDASHE
jgi:MFS transporter, NNP family, nitrate/nitrite transporter